MPSVKPAYIPVTQNEYCCVPSCIQMVLVRRGFECGSQEEIGWELGLIVPKSVKNLFKKVRAGKKPKAGYGARTQMKRYSYESYFKKTGLPLEDEYFKVGQVGDAAKFIVENIRQGNDIIVCFYSDKLFGEGAWGHVSLVQAIDGETVTLIDPGQNRPKKRKVKLERLLKAMKFHEGYSKKAGFTVIKNKNT